MDQPREHWITKIPSVTGIGYLDKKTDHSISEHKYVRIWNFSGYRVWVYRTFNVYIYLFRNFTLSFFKCNFNATKHLIFSNFCIQIISFAFLLKETVHLCPYIFHPNLIFGIFTRHILSINSNGLRWRKRRNADEVLCQILFFSDLILKDNLQHAQLEQLYYTAFAIGLKNELATELSTYLYYIDMSMA